MISLTLFPKLGGTRFVELEIKNLKQGVNFLLFSMENLSGPESEGVSLAITERGNEQFPSIHFQQVGDRYFFQLYVGDQAEGTDEGWHCLVDKQPEQEADDLISTVWDEPGSSFFQARFADGLMLHESLLVSRESLTKLLSQYSESFSEWHKQGTWVNLGTV
ncbi:hypothetical protein LU640_20650 [Pseudomonas monteilii]|uniref:hypothetical protein n=1 Tax=Pseudomonas monteilii TaxID=76759 RepID=UPI001E4D8E4B|nr:hypothetical protein [Pseudomonas monteilii]MCE1021052.1 hypothetical protein [Pseudomonas monteilii]MCE1089056.1 hypothetical protein [Pseudomonas monteilii]